jgi:hypothetical protein
MSDEQLQAAVLSEMSTWFGADKVATWSHLKSYRSALGNAEACSMQYSGGGCYKWILSPLGGTLHTVLSAMWWLMCLW